MDIRNRRAIHSRAQEALHSAPANPGNIALWYTVICSVMALIFTVLTGFLTDRIANTGGLSNMGLRSILSTGQSILPLIQLVITTCLSLGYHFAVLRIARGQKAEPTTLLDGFRNFGPALRATFLQALLYIFYGFTTLYLSMFLFMATPFSQPFYEIMEPLMESVSVLGTVPVIEETVMNAAMATLQPVVWIWLGLFLLLFLPAYFSYRMTSFCIADNPRSGALACMHRSKMLLRRNRFALFKLDLSMWWFYLLQALISGICYGDILLPMFGVNLPWSGTFSYYFFFVLSLILQIISYYFLMNRVNVAYAVAYDSLAQPRESQRPEKENFPFPTEY